MKDIIIQKAMMTIYQHLKQIQAYIRKLMEFASKRFEMNSLTLNEIFTIMCKS